MPPYRHAWRNLPLAFAWGAAYVAFGLIATILLPSQGPLLWYPAIAIGVAMVLIHGFAYLPVLFVAEAVVSYIRTGSVLSSALIIASGEMLQAAFARRALWSGGKVTEMNTGLGFLRFAVLGAIVPCLLGSIFENVLLAMTGRFALNDINATTLVWWVGDSVSIICFTPVILSFAQSPYFPAPRGVLRVEDTVVLGLIAVLCVLGVVHPTWGFLFLTQYRILAFLPVIWAAIRLGSREVFLVVALIDAMSAIIASHAGMSQVLNVPAGYPSFFEIQIFMATLGLGGGALGLAIEGEKRARAASQNAEALLREANRRLEDKVAARTEQLTLANRELEAFSYSVSHDLRAPLRAILGFGRHLLAADGGPEEPDASYYLSRIVTAAGRMDQLIEGLHRLSRFSRAALRPERVDLSAIAAGIAEELKTAEPERAVEFTIAPGLVAHADPALARVVLDNLLRNAWKFTSPRPVAHITFGAVTRDGSYAFFVRDDGVGFDAAHATKLFDAFQRFHAESEFPGTGIGLATVHRIITRHHGMLWVDSEVGQGTTVTFTLPDEGLVTSPPRESMAPSPMGAREDHAPTASASHDDEGIIAKPSWETTTRTAAIPRADQSPPSPP